MKKIFLAFFLLSSIVFAANTIELTGEYAKDLGNPFRVLLEKKDKQKGKEDRLEKGDFLALLIAASSTFWPILLGAIVILALLIFGWNAIFA